MHYLIFIPNKAAPNKQNLIDAGLSDLVRDDDESPMCADLIGRGPGDLPGQIWSWGNANPFYLPEQQTWTQCGDAYWFGVTNGKPPTSQDLLRKSPVNGIEHRMADGGPWVIPNVLALPAVFAEDSAGELLKVPHPKYQPFVDECSWAFQACMDVIEKKADPDWRRCLSFVVQALSINYRINRTIAIRLGILDEAMLHTCMAKAVDAAAIHDLIEELKKSGALSTLAG